MLPLWRHCVQTFVCTAALGSVLEECRVEVGRLWKPGCLRERQGLISSQESTRDIPAFSLGLFGAASPLILPEVDSVQRPSCNGAITVKSPSASPPMMKSTTAWWDAPRSFRGYRAIPWLRVCLSVWCVCLCVYRTICACFECVSVSPCRLSSEMRWEQACPPPKTTGSISSCFEQLQESLAEDSVRLVEFLQAGRRATLNLLCPRGAPCNRPICHGRHGARSTTRVTAIGLKWKTEEPCCSAVVLCGYPVLWAVLRQLSGRWHRPRLWTTWNLWQGQAGCRVWDQQKAGCERVTSSRRLWAFKSGGDQGPWRLPTSVSALLFGQHYEWYSQYLLLFQRRSYGNEYGNEPIRYWACLQWKHVVWHVLNGESWVGLNVLEICSINIAILTDSYIPTAYVSLFVHPL